MKILTLLLILTELLLTSKGFSTSFFRIHETARKVWGVTGSTGYFWPKPQHVPIPRQRMNITFAVMLMRTSYNMLDYMDAYPMDEFQREFFLLRQSEWEDYRSYFPGIVQGDLSDPFYFDFISFAQYASISNALRDSKQEYTEKVGASGEVVRVRRKEGYEDNSNLPSIHSSLVGDALLRFILEEGKIPSPKAAELGNLNKFCKHYDNILQFLKQSNYMIDYNLEWNQLNEKEILMKVSLRAPVILWSVQSLMIRKDRPLNDFESKLLRALAKEYGALKVEKVNSEAKSNIDRLKLFQPRLLRITSNLAGRRLSSTTAVADATTLVTTSGTLPITNKLNIVNTLEGEKIPVFRILGPDGKIVEGAEEPPLDEDLALKMYQHMVRIQYLDDIMYNAQRQGRISFYMQANGEEAIHIGAASAMDPKDMVFAQYREQGVLLWRGFTLQQATDQCFSNEDDAGKGRQMPVHYGSRELHYQTISSPLATQIPQAVGAAYAYKMEKAPQVPVCFFGEGAASEGDFHAALNFAAVLDTPILFFCRNNGYAISTPTKDQYRGDGIASRASGYGMHVIRVDGNDLLAVRKVVQEARKLALEKSVPVLIEAMSYRQGHHSTSDDSTRYRSPAEIKHWHDNYDPVTRFRLYMESKGWWTNEQEVALRDKERLSVLQAMEKAEKKPKPPLEKMFDDVYETKPEHILRQERELLEHIEKYPEHYFNSSH